MTWAALYRWWGCSVGPATAPPPALGSALCRLQQAWEHASGACPPEAGRLQHAARCDMPPCHLGAGRIGRTSSCGGRAPPAEAAAAATAAATASAAAAAARCTAAAVAATVGAGGWGAARCLQAARLLQTRHRGLPQPTCARCAPASKLSASPLVVQWLWRRARGGHRGAARVCWQPAVRDHVAGAEDACLQGSAGVPMPSSLAHAPAVAKKP